MGNVCHKLFSHPIQVFLLGYILQHYYRTGSFSALILKGYNAVSYCRVTVTYEVAFLCLILE
ncbi:hypothetical protein SDC9_205208 [bioreactor metagenome]|uniref:Uncharacterized protein n=1 Tax=bioreactor metagenome TaxID=1076179 RepID=A0A645JAM4_9ZZZZ